MFDRNSQKANVTKSKGMTLFELLVVLTILALLATVVAPRVVGYLGRAKSDVARTQLANLASSMELFFLDMGRYPTKKEGLIALVEAPETSKNWQGPYFKNESGILDPWGRAYLYAPNNKKALFELSTLGRDGVEGGQGEDADLFAK